MATRKATPTTKRAAATKPAAKTTAERNPGEPKHEPTGRKRIVPDGVKRSAARKLECKNGHIVRMSPTVWMSVGLPTCGCGSPFAPAIDLKETN